jgi:hypothetical protein
MPRRRAQPRGLIEARSGRLLVFADLVANIPLAAPIDLFGIDDDLGGIEAASQQGYGSRARCDSG